MRKALLFFLALAACSGGWGAETPLRIVSWNIEWYPGKFRQPSAEQEMAHKDVVARELAKMRPDVLLVQEMRDWESFAGLCEAVPGLRPAAVSAFVAEDTGEYWPQQLAVGSRLPVVAAWSEPWKAGTGVHPRRGFVAAALRLPSGRLLLVYSVHLKSNRAATPQETELNFRTREESARQLLAHVRQMEEVVFPQRVAAVVIGGDFNTNDDGQFGDRTIAMLKEAGFHHAWVNVPRAQRLTWRGNPQFEPTTFDHFFTKGLGEPSARMMEVSEAASDHHAILLDISPPK